MPITLNDAQSHEHQEDARAKRVIIIDTNGNVLVSIPIKSDIASGEAIGTNDSIPVAGADGSGNLRKLPVDGYQSSIGDGVKAHGYVCLTSDPTLEHTNTYPGRVSTTGGVMVQGKTTDGVGERLSTETTIASVKTSVEIMDDWDESNRAKVNPIAGQAGVAGGTGANDATVQRVSQAYNTEWLSLRLNYTSAQTNVSLISAGANQKIIVKSLDVMLDHACTVDAAVKIGFDDTTTPTGADCILSHPGIAPGSGVSKYYGSDGVTGATAADDLKITCEAPTTGSLDIVIIYKILSV